MATQGYESAAVDMTSNWVGGNENANTQPQIHCRSATYCSVVVVISLLSLLLILVAIIVLGVVEVGYTLWVSNLVQV